MNWHLGCDGDDDCWCPTQHQRDQGVRKPGLLSKCCPGLALFSPAHLNISVNLGSTCKHSRDQIEAVPKHTHTHTHARAHTRTHIEKMEVSQGEAFKGPESAFKEPELTRENIENKYLKQLERKRKRNDDERMGCLAEEQI